MKDLDTALTIMDIVICLIDMGLLVYLFFFRRRDASSSHAPVSRLHRPRRRARVFLGAARRASAAS